MKAANLCEKCGLKSRGSYAVIEIVGSAVRAPAAGEIRITVPAAAADLTDILRRTPGMDAGGIIEPVGPAVARLQAGENAIDIVCDRPPTSTP